jgi:hypothetical protein
MTTYDASLDYWSEDSTRPIPSHAVIGMEDEFDEFTADEHTYADLRRESRNRFLRFLLLNIVIWPILVYVGLQFSESHSPKVAKTLAVSGAQSMNADQLIATVKSQGRPVFWLNRLSGDTYSENSAVSGVDIISYLPEGTKLSTPGQLDLVIETYRDSNLFNIQLHPLSGTADTTVENVGGVTVTYNPASPDHSVVTFKDRPQIVAISYPGFQSVSTLVMDAQNLAPIN